MTGTRVDGVVKKTHVRVFND